MDGKLVGWARRVKAGSRNHNLPPLWLFTDTDRLADPIPAIARLPCRLAGVVLRTPAAFAPNELRRIARLCRARRLALSVADPAWAARLGAGLHVSRGIRRAGLRPRFVTSSAHNALEFCKARKAGAKLVFLSPIFRTLSHPKARALEPLRWSALARHQGSHAGALGGVDHRTIGRLPGWTRHAGAIGALL